MVGIPSLRSETRAVRSFNDLFGHASSISSQLRTLASEQAPSWARSLREEKAAQASTPQTTNGQLGTYSGVSSGFSSDAHETGVEASDAIAGRADAYAEGSESRTRGQKLDRVDDPRLILGSLSNVTIFAHDTTLLHAARTATLSADDTARLVAKQKVDIQSPEQIEVAGRRSVLITSSNVVDVYARQLSLFAVENRKALDDPLVPEVSLALLGERDVRLKSATAAVRACAEKDFVIHSHQQNVEIVAKQQLHGSAGNIKLESSGDATLDAGDVSIAASSITIDAGKGGTVTIKAGTITLDGNVTVTKDLTVQGKLSQG
jgi:hypothetical protein